MELCDDCDAVALELAAAFADVVGEELALVDCAFVDCAFVEFAFVEFAFVDCAFVDVALVCFVVVVTDVGCVTAAVAAGLFAATSCAMMRPLGRWW